MGQMETKHEVEDPREGLQFPEHTNYFFMGMQSPATEPTENRGLGTGEELAQPKHKCQLLTVLSPISTLS